MKATQESIVSKIEFEDHQLAIDIAGPCQARIEQALAYRRHFRLLDWLTAVSIGVPALGIAMKAATNLVMLTPIVAFALRLWLVASPGELDRLKDCATANLSTSEQIAWRKHVRQAIGLPTFVRDDLMDSWPMSPIEIAERIDRYQRALVSTKRALGSEY